MLPPKLAVMYHEGCPNVSILRFAETMNNETLTVHVEERPQAGPQAGVMWLLLTQAAVFIGASYFGGILKEIGKDHYEKLKKALAELTQETMTTPRIEPVLYGTAGKVSEDDPSMAFSIYANLPGGRTAKLLIPKGGGERDYAPIINAFMDFVWQSYDESGTSLEDAGIDLSRFSGGSPITVAYNEAKGKIEWMDPRPKHPE